MSLYKYVIMILTFIMTALFEILNIAYKWIDNNLITSFINFSKGFEYALIIMSTIFFLLISVSILLRNAKKLPKSYLIEVVDSHDKKITIDDIRYTFSTHDVAESYVRHYREIFKHYKFKVVGNRSNYL
ncbi:MAG TPA: hypothetical protein VH796_08725 [Nitrososphaeraceae archaeon]